MLFSFRYDDQGEIQLDFDSRSANKRNTVSTWSRIHLKFSSSILCLICHSLTPTTAIGSFSGVGPTQIRQFEGRFGSEMYLDLLKTNILPFTSSSLAKQFFIHDHFPVHNSAPVQKWFRDNNIELFPIPPKSGDLMPLSLVYNEIVLELNAQTAVVSSRQQLWAEVCEVFEQVCSTSFIEKTLNDIPTQLQTIIKNKGGLQD